MNTNSKIQPQKKIISVEILHLDELGYGPQGKHTRREWRKECLDNLLAGANVFKTWQESWTDLFNEEAALLGFECITHYEDGSSESFPDNDYSPKFRLDFSCFDFEEIEFEADISFLSSVSFAGAIFNNDINFSNAVFNAHVNFQFAKFCESADFTNAKFERHAIFSGVRFIGLASFSDAVFEKHVNFYNSNFYSSTFFNRAIFSSSADFRNITFNSHADFAKSIFNSYADFQNSIFNSSVIFNEASFSESAYFVGCKFNSAALFRQSLFKRQCRFDNEFNKDANSWSNETVFSDSADFENAIFKNVGHFERVQFLGQIPSFLGAENATTRLEFSDDRYFSKSDISEDAIKRLGLLKRLADEHGQTDQALNFNALELRAKALQPNAGFWFKWFTWLYEITSNYGRSFTKPLKYYLILLGGVFILALANAVYFSPKDCKQENLRVLSDLWRNDTPCDISETKQDDKIRLNGYRAAAEYTVYRAVGVLDFSDNGKATDAVARRLFGQNYEPGWMRFIGLIKAIASTALLFLAALGLRNKYRIK
jgi:Pentapeptide repeats (9 copies)